MILTTKFDMLQRVFIKELKTPARIMGIRYDGLGVVYQLEYWMNGEIKVVNLYEDEVTSGD